MHSDIRGRYGNAFTSVFTKEINLTNQAHGGMYHLAKIAQYHFMSEQDSSQPKLKAVEGERTVQFYAKKLGKETAVSVQKRKLDIILQAGADVTKEIWVELKSLNYKAPFTVWKYHKTKGGGTRGKEIIVDRAASERAPTKGVWVTTASESKEYISQVDLRWRFQVFDVKANTKTKRVAQRSYSKTEFDKVLEKMSKIGTGDEIKHTLNLPKPIEFKADSIAKLDTITTWLIDSAGSLFESLNLDET